MNQQQVHELPPRQERPRSFWKRYRTSSKARIGSVILAFLVVGSLFFIVFVLPIFRQAQPTVAPTTLTPDDVVKQILLDENTNGWDPRYQGILINWRRDDLSLVNCSDKRCDKRGDATRHDPANDLRDLENLYWYRSRHPDNMAVNDYIARILPTVKREWGNTTMPKGWLYYILLRLDTYSGDHAYWDMTIQHWLQAQYKTTDLVLGVHHAPIDDIVSSTPKVTVTLDDGYRVDLDLELGLVLVDAGTRYHHPEWIAAGRQEVNIVIQQAFDTTYHLFNRIYLVYDHRYGSRKVVDDEARMGENGQEIEALLRTGMYTKTTAYLQLAKEMLDALQASPLHDTVHKGFYFKIFLRSLQGHSAGEVNTSMKETRQLHMLPSLVLANRVFSQRWAALEAEMLHMATTDDALFLPAPVPGYSYEILPDGHLFPCATCQPAPTENWVSAEADNIGLEGLQAVLGDASLSRK